MKVYVLVWAVLILLTAATTGIALIDLGPFNAVAALAIAVIKMLLVALFFMHVLHSPKLTKLVVAGGLFWLALLIFLTMSDFMTRGWLPFPGIPATTPSRMRDDGRSSARSTFSSKRSKPASLNRSAMIADNDG